MDDDNSILPPPKRTPWNKGKLIGAKPPLLARQLGDLPMISRRPIISGPQCQANHSIALCPIGALGSLSG